MKSNIEFSPMDFVVVGGGIIGLNVALNLKKKFPDCSIAILEKEKSLGIHGSGRNSGVLHAGFYYSADTMKAKFCRDGSQQLTEFCLDRSLPINRCGKLVVAADEADLHGLSELLQRGRANGVLLEEVSQRDAMVIEPRAITFERAIFSPTTSTVSPSHVIQAFENEVRNAGIKVMLDTAFLSRDHGFICTNRGKLEAKYVVNTAGLYADRIAKQYGFSKEYCIIPFKGLYLYESSRGPGLKTNIYPVPDLRYPFLGVHFTVDVSGNVKIGPTAIPAFWREQYNGLENFDLREVIDICRRDLILFMKNDFGFRDVALTEFKKRSASYLSSQAGKLARNVRAEDYTRWGKPGIRAQLINTRTKRLEMDFKIEGDDKSFHVLNAVSPAFTCAMPFAAHVVEQIEQLVR